MSVEHRPAQRAPWRPGDGLKWATVRVEGDTTSPSEKVVSRPLDPWVWGGRGRPFKDFRK